MSPLAAGAPALSRRDLSEFSHVVATRQGLWGVSRRRSELLAPGAYFGLTRDGASILAFDKGAIGAGAGLPGRILRFSLDRDAQTAIGVEVVVDGLDAGCHQIDLVDGRLHIVDTHHQRILVHDLRGPYLQTLRPVPFAGDRASNPADYVHLNGFVARGAVRWYMLHNNGQRPSELLRTDAAMTRAERIPLAGTGCHDIVPLEDGDLLYCASAQGLVASTRGRRAAVIPGLMTRGLSVGDAGIVVGSSLFGPRHLRAGLPGAVSFLDRDLRLLGHVALPGSPTDILALRGADLSLST